MKRDRERQLFAGLFEFPRPSVVDELDRNAVAILCPGSGKSGRDGAYEVLGTVVENGFMDVGERLRALRKERSWTETERDAFFRDVRERREERERLREDAGFAEERMEAGVRWVETVVVAAVTKCARKGKRIKAGKIRRRARKAARSALALLASPSGPAESMALGRVCLRYGLPAAAEDAFRSAVSGSPGGPAPLFVEALHGIATARDMLGDAKAAEGYSDLARSVADSSDDWRGWLPWEKAYRSLAGKG
jgi:hypothetical protein